MSKIVMWIIGIVVVLGGVWYFWSRSQAAPSPDTQQAQQQDQGTAQNTNADTSDQGMQQDAASIDTQLQAASTDTSAAGSFNDTPVQQTE